MYRRTFLACHFCGVNAIAHAQGREGIANGCLLLMPPDAALGLNREEFGAMPSADSIQNSSGDAALDKALGRALSRAARKFNVAPSFAFYRDADAPNAYASPDTMTSGTWGSVVFGRSLFQEQFSRYKDDGISVLAIVAHEFGHIIQYKNNLMHQLQRGEPTVRRIELHADFLAGWYLGVRKAESPTISLWGAGDTFNRIGDYEYNNPKHHGTPAQRVAASGAGFSSVSSGIANVHDAIEAGLSYMKKIS